MENSAATLRAPTDELIELRQTLAERIRRLENSTAELRVGKDRLAELEHVLDARSALLQDVKADLIEKTRALKNINARLEEIQQSRVSCVLKAAFQKLFK